MSRMLPILAVALLISTAVASHPNPVQAQAEITPSGGAPGKVQALVMGLAQSMQEAGTALQYPDQRLTATKALDDARRVARILKDVATGQFEATAKDGLQAVRNARFALQNGETGHAAQILLEDSQKLAGSARAAGGESNPASTNPANSVGLGIVNAKGGELGKVDSIATGPDGKRYAVLKEKGVVDLFGVFDIGNTLVVAPLDRIVVGKRMAALATDATADRLIESSRYDPQRFTKQDEKAQGGRG